MRILVTGSSGLVGSEACYHFCEKGCEVFGIDNNMRKLFFGRKGDTTWNLERMNRELKGFRHFDIDIRDFDKIEALFKKYDFNVIIHCAAQPSHDKAREIPILDFEVNANGTLNLLEAARKHIPESVFIFMSTNKVYGDAPNELPFKELETRYDYADPADYNGIDETCRIDRCLHSLFGASKLSGDVMAQEYGRYFGMKVGIFRGGCLTGPRHSGVELHGFLSYLVKAAMQGITYTIFGYRGKQVRDNIHSRDIIQALERFIENPLCGEVFNLGGGRENSISILEAIAKIEDMAQTKVIYEYKDQNRVGDHICYISDLSKLKKQFPGWKIETNLDLIFQEIIEFERYEKNKR